MSQAGEKAENGGENGGEQVEIEPLLVKRHAKYFERVLNILPGALSNLDSNR